MNILLAAATSGTHLFFSLGTTLSTLTTSASTTVATAAAAATATSTANPTMWYVTRTAAVCAYLALTLTVLLGLLRSLARVARVRSTWLLEDMHRYVATATAVFVAVHLTSLLLDPLIPFTPLNLLLPVAEPYRPVAVAVGIGAMYLLALVALSSWLRQHLPYALWRLLHYVSFAVFWLATLHGLLAGSDASQPWLLTVYIVAALAVGGGMLLRLFWPAPVSTPTASRRPPTRRAPIRQYR